MAEARLSFELQSGRVKCSSLQQADLAMSWFERQAFCEPDCWLEAERCVRERKWVEVAVVPVWRAPARLGRES